MFFSKMFHGVTGAQILKPQLTSVPGLAMDQALAGDPNWDIFKISGHLWDTRGAPLGHFGHFRTPQELMGHF